MNPQTACPALASRNENAMAGPRDARGCAVTASPGVAGDGARNKAGCRPDQNAVRAIIGQPVRSPINRQLAVRILMHPP